MSVDLLIGAFAFKRFKYPCLYDRRDVELSCFRKMKASYLSSHNINDSCYVMCYSEYHYDCLKHWLKFGFFCLNYRCPKCPFESYFRPPTIYFVSPYFRNRNWQFSLYVLLYLCFNYLFYGRFLYLLVAIYPRQFVYFEYFY